MWILSSEVISTALIGAAGIVLFLASGQLIRYAKSIRKRLKQLQDDARLFNSGMVRLDPEDRPSVSEQPMRILELNPEFVEANKHFPMVSLGQYLSSLRPAMLPKDMELSDWMETELQATMGVLLLSYLGPSFGKTMLPSLGFGAVQSKTHAIASTIARWWAGHFDDEDGKTMKKSKKNPISSDSGVFPSTLTGMIESANTHGQVFNSYCSRCELLLFLSLTHYSLNNFWQQASSRNGHHEREPSHSHGNRRGSPKPTFRSESSGQRRTSSAEPIYCL
jgi:hypothetical protein